MEDLALKMTEHLIDFCKEVAKLANLSLQDGRFGLLTETFGIYLHVVIKEVGTTHGMKS